MKKEKNINLQGIILEEIYKNFSFVPYEEIKGIDVDPKKEEPGLLQRNFLLSELRSWTKKAENGDEDEEVLDALDRLAAMGKIHLFSVKSDHLLHFNNFQFSVYLGTARRTLGTSDVQLTPCRLHNTHPLTEEEQEESRCILNPSERIAGIKKRRDRAFSQSLGNPTDPLEREKEKKVEKAYIEAQWQWRKDISELSKNIKILSSDIHTLLDLLNAEKEAG